MWCRARAQALGSACAWALATGAFARAELRVSSIDWQETTPVQANGHVEPGETGNLRVALWNSGDAPARSLAGTLSLVAPPTGVQVTSSLTTWADIAPGAVQQDLGGFALTIDPPVACGTVLTLTLTVASSDPAVDLPLALRVGIADPQVVAPVLGATGETSWQSIAWSGSEYGVAWLYGSVPFAAIRFQRYDPTGVQIGTPITLPSADGHDTEPSIAWAGDRWAIVRSDLVGLHLALLDASGGVISQEYLDTWTANTLAQTPTLAFDGAGLGVAFHAAPWTTTPPPDVRRQLGFVHATPDGVVDGGPVLIDAGTDLTLWREPILWNGAEFAVLCWDSAGMRVVRLDKTGTVISMTPIMPLVGDNPDLAWSGRSYGIAVSDGANLNFIRVSADGSPGQPLTIDWMQSLNSGPEEWHRMPAVIASDGFGFGIACPMVGPRSPPLVPDDLWVRFLYVDESGTAYRAPIRTTTAIPGLPYWWTGKSCVWNPDSREFALPVVANTDEATAGEGDGQVELQRIPLSTWCAQGEVPGEVSGPLSGSPLRATKWIEHQCPTCGFLTHVVLHVQDLGPVAYDEYVLGTSRRGAAQDGTWLDDRYCHMTLGSDSRIAQDGAGRVVLDAHLYGASNSVSPLEWLLVSASNQWGEGTRGVSSTGAEEPPVNGCLGLP